MLSKTICRNSAKKLIVAAILTTTLFACKKKTEDGVVLNTYLSKVINPGISSSTFSYDAQNRLSTVSYEPIGTNTNVPNIHKNFKYNGSGVVEEYVIDRIPANVTDFKVVNVFDNNGEIIRVNVTSLTTNALDNYYTIEKLNNNLKYSFYTASGTLKYYEVTTYPNSTTKNFIETKTYSSNNTIDRTFTYTNYDQNKNPSYLLPKGYYTSSAIAQNNAATIVRTDANGTTTTFNYTNNYDADGYVTKRASTQPGDVTNYEYIKR